MTPACEIPPYALPVVAPKVPPVLGLGFPSLRAKERSGFHREAFGYDLRLIHLTYRGEGNDVRFTTRTNRIALARRARGAIRDIQGSLARKSDRARRGHVRATSPRPDAVLPLRLPGRHVRLLRHDRERPAALDLPHACRDRRRRWPPRDRPACEPTGHQGFGRRPAALLRQVAAGQRGLR